MAGLFFVLGFVFGYVSLALGPLGLIEALVVLGIVLWQVRRFPERSGAYLIGLSLLPVILLSIIVSQVPACTSASETHCYAPIAIPALAAFAIAGLIGAFLLARTLPSVVTRPMSGSPDKGGGDKVGAALKGKTDKAEAPSRKDRPR